MKLYLFAILATVLFIFSPLDDCGLSSDSIASGSRIGHRIFFDDFSGKAESRWHISPPPSPRIDLYRGDPAPCMDNNGDGSRNSGILSKRKFRLSPGTVIRCDMNIYPYGKDMWIGGSFGLPLDPASFHQGRWPEWLVGMSYKYIGKLEWTNGLFQEEGTLVCYLIDEDGNPELNRAAYHNQYLKGWHTFEIMIKASGFVEFRIDGELIYYSRKRVCAVQDYLPLLLGHRSGSGGKVYHDNVEVLTYGKKDRGKEKTLKRKEVKDR
ncbi:MAG: hypothetical protein U9N73_00025 [Candidatus Auribacterota bacterium]|nr:hypothetical protein [Candidatus Auribacterota bacterium]